MEFHPDGLAVRVPKLIQDVAGLAPRGPRGAEVTGVALGVAEMRQHVGEAVPVAGLTEQGHSVVEAGDRPVVVAEAAVDVAETVPGVRLTGCVAQVLEHFQRLLTQGQGIGGCADEGAVPADRVEAVGLPGPMAGPPEQLQGGLGVAQRLEVVALLAAYPGEVPVCVRLADVVARVPEQLERGAVVRGRLVELTPAGVREPQAAPRGRFRDRIGQPSRRSQRGPLGGHQVLPATVPVQIVRQRPRHFPGLDLVTCGVRELDGVQQVGVFGPEPGQRLFRAVEALRRDTLGRRRRAVRVPMRVQPQRRGVGGVEVVVDQPALGGQPELLDRWVAGQLTGVRPQQVVTGVPAGQVLGEQVRAGQLQEQPARGGRVDAGEAAQGRCADVRAGMDAEQAEQFGRRRAQRAVRPQEDTPEIGGGVPARERCQGIGGGA
ncbi:hypothetical protein Ais01nite_64990 [Asanoa ishikariensis]|nr:hypothetical protein Ais01nite_64990 [Asanoa ishikariensis]